MLKIRMGNPIQDITLKAWKQGDHPMGEDVRPYCPEAPASTDGNEINVNEYGFKLVQVTVDNRKSGWAKFTFKLPQSVRAMYHNDVVYGSDWRALMKDFDDRFLNLLMFYSMLFPRCIKIYQVKISYY